jgi:hypothetical protein
MACTSGTKGQDFSRLCDDLIENVQTLMTPGVTHPCPLTPQ